MKKIIWTPDLYGTCDFGINLDNSFAKEMIYANTTREKQNRLNELASQDLKKQGIDWPDPYTFHYDTCFLSKLYIGQNGVGLFLERPVDDYFIKEIERNSKPIEYHSHNVDRMDQAYALMKLFNKYVKFSNTLKKD